MSAPSALNIFIMAQHFGAERFASRKIALWSAAHMRKCYAAGYFVRDEGQYMLTDAGIAAIDGDALAREYVERKRTKP